MKRTLLEVGIFLLVFAGAIAGASIWRIEQIKKLHAQPFSPQTSDFFQHPPPAALTGSISEISGDVQKDARNIVDLIPLTATASGQLLTIISGEGLVTGPDSLAIVTFPGFATAQLASNTQAAFDNPFPDSFLVRQTRGSIKYGLVDPAKSLSVRSLHFLVTFSEGNAEITVDEAKKTATITLSAGQAQIGMLDISSNTKTWSVQGPTTVTINDRKRTVTEEKTEPSN